MLQKIPKRFAAFVLILFFQAVMTYGDTGPESVVVGRLTGTIHRPPHAFIGNSSTVGGDRGSVEFRGFRLVQEDGKTFTIRPLGDGYFRQALPPGNYSLVRQRRDRPSYRENGVITILIFTVPANSLINLGTLGIILAGDPEETFYRPSRKQAKGVYIYRYRYERPAGKEAQTAPLKRYMKRETTVSMYADRILTIEADPTETMDSSRFTLREKLFRLPLLNWR